MYVVRVVGAAIVQQGRCLAAQRGPGLSAAGKWEFPGGKIEPGESPRAALVREIEEELGVSIAVGEHLGRGEAPGDRSTIQLDVYAARVVRGTPAPTEHSQIQWLEADALAALDWAAADVPVLPRVVAWLREAGAKATGD